MDDLILKIANLTNKENEIVSLSLICTPWIMSEIELEISITLMVLAVRALWALQLVWHHQPDLTPGQPSPQAEALGWWS